MQDGIRKYREGHRFVFRARFCEESFSTGGHEGWVYFEGAGYRELLE
jgi:hypothetical protein